VTGKHRGSMQDYSGSRGASFIPDRPFAQGERVKLVVRIRDRKPVRRTFTIARLGPVQPVLNLKKQQPDKLQHFISEPNLLPPRVDINKDVGGTLKLDITTDDVGLSPFHDWESKVPADLHVAQSYDPDQALNVVPCGTPAPVSAVVYFGTVGDAA